MPNRRIAAKRVLLGRPLAGAAKRRELLPRRLALPAFGADPLSSVAYASHEMLLVLALAGAGALTLAGPVSVAVGALFVLVVLSYRQMIRAYPQGGGAYTVARENLGEVPSLVAAGALLVSYVLTVAVATAAAVAAIVSIAPDLAGQRAVLAVGIVALVSLAHLRGIQEMGWLSAVPTYAFVTAIGLVLVTGLTRCAIAGCPEAPSAGAVVDPAGALTAFVILRAFATGASALTGLDAMTNSSGALKHPQRANAARTMAIVATLGVTAFVGVSYLAGATGVVAGAGELTALAEVTIAALGTGPLFWFVQIATAGILLVAAGGAYADFPRLASVLASDRFLPRQFVARGDRLVHSGAILLIALGAAVLLVVYGAAVSGLIELYVAAVFVAFTLSMAGMARHHLRNRSPGWERGVALNVSGAVAASLVALVAAAARIDGGTWALVVAIAATMWLMSATHRHYSRVGAQLRAGVADPLPTGDNHVVLLLDTVDEPVARAISYARAIMPASLEAVALPRPGADVERRWHDLAPDIPLTVVEPDADGAQRMRAIVRARAESRDPSASTTALVSETLSRSWWEHLRLRRPILRPGSEPLVEDGIVLTDFTSPGGGPGPYTLEDPAVHHVIVLVAGVNHATMRALAYAKGLHATTIRALNINVDPASTRSVLEAWERWGIDVPLELIDSPFREVSGSLRSYLREFAPDGRSTIVTCVLPQFVLPHWYQAPLHNQTALLIRGSLMFERGVVTTNVPTRTGKSGLLERGGTAA